MEKGAGRYEGLETYGGETSPSETARRYREDDKGMPAGFGDIRDKMPSNQSLGSIEKSLPNESPESLLSEADRAAKRVGSDSEIL